MSSFLLALVHDGRAERLAHIRPALSSLADNLRERYLANIAEFAEQPEIKPGGYAAAIGRSAMYRRWLRDWNRYRGLVQQGLVAEWAEFFRGTLRPLFSDPQAVAAWQRRIAIEPLVTAKHLRAWQAFLDSGAAFLVVFEDDAVFKPDSIRRFREGLADRLATGESKGLYVDLAGGLPREALQLQNLEAATDGAFRHYRKPAGNTACAYMVDRHLALAFRAALDARPGHARAAIDWTINRIFMDMGEAASTCLCLHAEPPIFEHGSFTGAYGSWQGG